MRQVPHYLLIGRGRLARHLGHYFDLLALSYDQWHRQSPTPLAEVVTNASHVLLLISDHAIDAFIADHPILQTKQLIHCSGSHLSDTAVGIHPLMSFGASLYDLAMYQRIPFILEQDQQDFAILLPGLPNPHFVIPRAKKAYYHSLCVMANNFTTLLWQKFFYALEHELQIPAHYVTDYLQQTFNNLASDPRHALTGPLVRGDQSTIDQNLTALQSDPFHDVYEAFVRAYQLSNQELT
ncbi:MAG: DUF2520 domain-containing protein [Legionellales bacterium]|nr:DUF2520 domain-containing protein [Legionellales bacterium]